MKNLIVDQPIDKHLKPVKDSDGTSTSIELSDSKIRVKDLEVTGTTTGISTGTTITVDSSLTDGSANPVENNAVFDGLATKLNLSGGNMTGSINMADNTISDVNRLIFNDGGFITELIDNDDMSNVSNTKVSSSESIKAYVDKTITQIIPCGFNYSYTAGTKIFLPLNGYIFEISTTTGVNEYVSFVAPFDGYLDQVVVRSEEACGSTVVGLHKSSTGTEVPNSTASASVTVDMTADDTPFKFDFTSNNTFTAGQILAVSFQPTNDANDTNASVVFVFDRTQGV